MSLDSAPPPCHTRRRVADFGPSSLGWGLDLASSHLYSIYFAGCSAAPPAGHASGRRQLQTAQDSVSRTKAHAGARAAARDGVHKSVRRGASAPEAGTTPRRRPPAPQRATLPSAAHARARCDVRMPAPDSSKVPVGDPLLRMALPPRHFEVAEAV